tara:strand:- start:111 stop:563 length:453 start_codon:yes stop_codon:yes gene_type:complete
MSWNDLRKGRFSLAHNEYFITFNTQDRISYFNEFNLASLFCQQIAMNEKRHRCIWLTWVLMPDHFHGLVQLKAGGSDLSTVIGALKGTSAYELNKYMNRKGRLWQPSFYDRALRTDDDRITISRYIVANPLRKGLVISIKDYPFWHSVYL